MRWRKRLHFAIERSDFVIVVETSYLLSMNIFRGVIVKLGCVCLYVSLFLNNSYTPQQRKKTILVMNKVIRSGKICRNLLLYVYST